MLISLVWSTMRRLISSGERSSSSGFRLHVKHRNPPPLGGQGGQGVLVSPGSGPRQAGARRTGCLTLQSQPDGLRRGLPGASRKWSAGGLPGPQRRVDSTRNRNSGRCGQWCAPCIDLEPPSPRHLMISGRCKNAHNFHGFSRVLFGMFSLKCGGYASSSASRLRHGR